jgi:MFS family permease
VVTIVSTVGFNFHVLVPILAADTLHVGAEGFGLLSASFGLGALVGALATATFRAASWRLFASGAAGFGVLAFALAPVENAVLAGVLLFAVGISFTLFTANANALVQLGSPDQLRGRMIALYLFAFVGIAPVGGLLTGWMAEVGGTELAFSVAGATSLVTIGVASVLRQRAPTPAV